MRPEKQLLIHDLLDDASRRDMTLFAAAKILRRRRQWRAAWQTFALLMLAAAAVMFVNHDRQRPTLAQVSPAAAKPSAPFRTQSLTDDQLLSLFPNTPVGLAKLPNGKKLLIFPRPADEARFVMRL
jgi:hypothetical protein